MRNPADRCRSEERLVRWIPACAGMTGERAGTGSLVESEGVRGRTSPGGSAPSNPSCRLCFGFSQGGSIAFSLGSGRRQIARYDHRHQD